MPIITKVPGSDELVSPVLEQTREKTPSTVVMTERRNSIQGMSSYVKGSPLVVDEYFKQYLLKDDLPRDFDDQSSGVVQQYQVVRDMVIKVTSSSAARQDTNTGVFKGSQTAIVHAGLSPYVGDLMVIRTLINRRVLYRVSRVERLTIIESSSYQIEFEHMRVLDDNSEILSHLRSKIVFSSVFDADRAGGAMGAGVGGDSAALVPLPTYENIRSIESLIPDLVTHYMDDFFDMRSATLLWNSDEHDRIYDPWVTRYALDVFSEDHDVRVREVAHYSGERWDTKNGASSIYSAIQQRRPEMVRRIPKARAIIRNVLSSTYDIVAYQDIDFLSIPVDVGQANPVYALPIGVYTDTPTTDFECLVIDHMHRRPLSPGAIVAVANESESWSLADRYYWVPVLVGVMLTSIKEL